MTPRRVLVTRPAREATRWVDALRSRGLDAVSLPLLETVALEDPGAIRSVAQRGGDYDALMFVSAAAVQHFFAAAPPGLIARPRFWATGPGTASALRAEGVPESSIDVPDSRAPQFDSEALWDIVRPQVGTATRVLIVRGGDELGRAEGREWLADQIQAAGAQHDTVVAYRRRPAAWTSAQRQLAQAACSDGSVWLFSSSRAVANLLQMLPQAHWGSALAVATHARIARAATDAGFGVVRTSNADVDALSASIESLG
ncbi:uroporphyrinogen-III synthase [Variovorax sp. J22R133]|uniref:uroporphyrinogen-III synthase n=1 Tax=Variovorax brevis TaxID=3053503 RepID=UPI002574BCE1|nr:uroporphyrinogen-III synthase [Variovorax sp. J22R133]MDM0114280.1 uroporphyrinogen-III synthase [Variovorax sp. J22R133]